MLRTRWCQPCSQSRMRCQTRALRTVFGLSFATHAQTRSHEWPTPIHQKSTHIHAVTQTTEHSTLSIQSESAKHNQSECTNTTQPTPKTHYCMTECPVGTSRICCLSVCARMCPYMCMPMWIANEEAIERKKAERREKKAKTYDFDSSEFSN